MVSDENLFAMHLLNISEMYSLQSFIYISYNKITFIISRSNEVMSEILARENFVYRDQTKPKHVTDISNYYYGRLEDL